MTRVLAIVFLGAIACAGPERARARVAAQEQLPMPTSVDMALRVDATALGADLGEGPTRQFLLDALSSQGQPPETTRLLELALARTTVLWLGIDAAGPAAPAGSARADSTAIERSGSILVLRGRFSGLEALDSGWTSPGARVEARDLPGSADGYGRVYRVRDEELMIWAPRAELGAVESALRGDSRGASLRPPERGAVSIAVRPEGLLERYGARFPELAEHFRGVRSISAFAEPTSGMWRADLTLDFSNAREATLASALAERLKQAFGKRPCAIGTIARALVVSSFDRNLRVQMVLLPPEVELVKACVLGGSCCG